MKFVVPISFHCFNKWFIRQFWITLKGHGNEADFLGFLQKLVPHESITLSFEPFRFWLRFRGDIHIQKTINDTWSRQFPASLIRRIDGRLTASPIRRVGSWIFLKKTLCIDDTESRRRLSVSLGRGVDDSADRWYGESLLKEKNNLVSIFRTFKG